MNEKNKKGTIRQKKLIMTIIIAIIILAIIIAIVAKIVSLVKLDDFKKYTIYSYLENDVLNVYTLYQLGGKASYDETQVFQSKLKEALDNYFSTNSGDSISASEALSLVDSIYVPDNVDFHGIIVSGYEYNAENDTIEKSSDSHSNMATIESEVNSVDYSNQVSKVQKIKKVNNTSYKVYFNIVDTTNGAAADSDNATVEASGVATVSLVDGSLVIEDCSFDE